jgi:hypothetical protein
VNDEPSRCRTLNDSFGVRTRQISLSTLTTTLVARSAITRNDLHEIAFADPTLGDNRYVIVKIQLFANHKMPVHYVVVGELAALLE